MDSYFELTFTDPQLLEACKSGQTFDLVDALSHEDQGVQIGESVHVHYPGVTGEKHLQHLHRRKLSTLCFVGVESIACTLHKNMQGIQYLIKV